MCIPLDEYITAENELKTVESPDPELEAEEERKVREMKMKRKKRRAERKIERAAKEEEGRNMQTEAPYQTKTSGIEEKDGEEGTSTESYEDTSGSSTEEDKDKEDEATDVQRMISPKTLLKVSEKIRGAF